MKAGDVFLVEPTCIGYKHKRAMALRWHTDVRSPRLSLHANYLLMAYRVVPGGYLPDRVQASFSLTLQGMKERARNV